MNYFKKLVGEKLYLSPLNTEDYEMYTEWMNDLDISTNLLVGPLIISKVKEKELLEKMSSDGNIFAIVDKEKDKLVGNCGLVNIDTINRNAQIAIFIGDKAYRNKGYGQEAIELLLDFGFNIRNLHNISLTVKSFNKSAIRCYEKCGFKKAGIRREVHIFGTKKYDEILMDLLSHEFKSKIVMKLLDEKA